MPRLMSHYKIQNSVSVPVTEMEIVTQTCGSRIDVRLELRVWKKPRLVGVSRGVVVEDDD